MRLIPTRAHGMLDYVTAGAYCVLPRAFGATTIGQRVMYGFAAATALYSACTRYELGVVKKLPMPAHLALDAVSGVLIAGAAFSHKRASSRAMLIGMGAFAVAVALLTETRTSLDPQPRKQTSTAPIIALPRQVRQLVGQK